MRDESGEEEASAEDDDERKDPFRVPPPPPIFHTFERERDGNGHQLGCQVEEEMNDRFAPPPPPTFPRIPTCNVLAEKMPFSLLQDLFACTNAFFGLCQNGFSLSNPDNGCRKDLSAASKNLTRVAFFSVENHAFAMGL